MNNTGWNLPEPSDGPLATYDGVGTTMNLKCSRCNAFYNFKMALAEGKSFSCKSCGMTGRVPSFDDLNIVCAVLKKPKPTMTDSKGEWILYSCGSCRYAQQVGTHMSGGKLRCLKCGTINHIPDLQNPQWVQAINVNFHTGEIVFDCGACHQNATVFPKLLDYGRAKCAACDSSNGFPSHLHDGKIWTYCRTCWRFVDAPPDYSGVEGDCPYNDCQGRVWMPGEKKLISPGMKKAGRAFMNICNVLAAGAAQSHRTGGRCTHCGTFLPLGVRTQVCPGCGGRFYRT